MTHRQFDFDFARRLSLRVADFGDGSITNDETTFLYLACCLPFMEGSEDFGYFFYFGFSANLLIKCLDNIDHRPAAATVRLARRIYCSSPSNAALRILGLAFCRMEPSICAHLAEFQRRRRF